MQLGGIGRREPEEGAVAGDGGGGFAERLAGLGGGAVWRWEQGINRGEPVRVHDDGAPVFAHGGEVHEPRAGVGRIARKRRDLFQHGHLRVGLSEFAVRLREQGVGAFGTVLFGPQLDEPLQRRFRLGPAFGFEVRFGGFEQRGEIVRVFRHPNLRLGFIGEYPGRCGGPVELWPGGFRELQCVRGKLRIQLFNRRKVRGERRVHLHAARQIAEHAFHFLQAPPLHQPLRDKRRFVVRKAEMRGRFRLHERAAQLAHGREVVAEDHRPVARLHPLAPVAARLPLLIDAEPFAQPARHLVFGQRERDDMREFVPQHRLPICRRAGVRRRAVRRDDAAKAHAEIAHAARQSERADREILLVGENLHHRFLTRGQAILFCQSGVRALQKREHLRAVSLRLARLHADLEMLALQHGEMRDGVAQRGEIERHHVVRVRLLHLVRELPSFLVEPETQEILRELDFCGRKCHVELQRLALQRRALGETVLLRKLVPDEMRHCGIRRPELQRLGALSARRLLIRAQVREHRTQCVRLGVARIRAQHLGDLLVRLWIILGINRVIREQHVRSGVVWIQLQHLRDLLRRRLVVARCERPREAEVRLRIFRKLLHRRRKTFRCEREVVLRQREFAVREIRAGKIRAQLFHRIEKQFRHALRIRTEQDRRLSQRHAIRRLAVGPLTLIAKTIHLLLHHPRALRFTIREEDIVAEQPQLHRIREALQR